MPVDYASAKSRRQRGFSLLVSTILVGLMVLTAMGVLEALDYDTRLHYIEDRIYRARVQAQGGLRELVNDRQILNILPSAAGESSQLDFSPPASSEFWSSTDSYEAKATLVRSSPALESSQRNVRVVLYEIEVRGRESSGQTSDVEAIVYRLGVVPNNQSGAELYGR